MTSIHKPKTLETFVADWNAVGSPEYIDYGRFTEAGHDIHCSNTYRVSREVVNPKILGLHSPNRSLTVSPTWHKDGVGLTLGYPGVHGLGQAIYPIAELHADGSIVELHGWGQQPVPEVAAGERAFGSAMAPTAVTPDNAQAKAAHFRTESDRIMAEIRARSATKHGLTHQAPTVGEYGLPSADQRTLTAIENVEAWESKHNAGCYAGWSEPVAMPESQKRAAAKENGQNVSYVAGMRIDGHDQPWLVLIERSSSAVSDPENRGGYIAQAVSAAINADLFVKTIMAREASQAHLLSEEIAGTPPGVPAPLGMRSLPTPSLGCAPSFGHG